MTHQTLDPTALRALLLNQRLRGTAAPSPADGISPAPRGGPLPLSFAQQRLWVLDRLSPDTTTYLMTSALRLRGPLDVRALRGALDAVVARHEVLRTRYPVVDGKPSQVIDPPAPVELTETDLTGLDAAARARRLAALGTSERQPVDLAAGPVLRAVLARCAPEEHMLFTTVHHIAADGRAEDLLVREVTEQYRRLAGQELPPPPPPALQYADFAVWQRGRLTEERLDEGLGYWRNRLAGLAPLELPTDRPRPAVREESGAVVPFTVPAEVAAALTRLAHEHGATPFMACLAAFQVLLSRYTGSGDIAVGTPVSGRDRPETEEMLGLFLNTLVLRTDLSGDPGFAEVLTRLREGALDDYGHQEVPFERLVNALAPERDPSRTPLFATMFLWEGAGGQDAARTGDSAEGTLTVDPTAVGETTAKFDLTLSLTERPDGSLSGGLNYATALFDPATAERMAGHFTRLLASAVADPDAPVTGLELMSEPERQQVLHDWNDTATRFPGGTLHGMFEAQAAATPQAVAVTDEAGELSYAELDRRANAVAAELLALGAGPGTVTGVCLDRSRELLVALLGILKAGSAYLPLEPELPAERRRYMLTDSGARILLTGGDAGQAGDTPADVAVLSLGRDGLFPGGSPTRADAHTAAAPGPDDAAYVIYTSGSTGRPKGVLVEHRAIVNRLRWMQEEFGLDATDRVLQKTPMGFDVSVWEFFWPVATGATLVMARPGGHRDPDYLARTIAEKSVTTLHFVPSMLRAFLSGPGTRLPSVRRIVCSGEALPGDLVTASAERLGVTPHNLYGPTEAAVDVTSARCVPGQRVTIGKPVANTRTYIVDAALRPVPVGVPGELLLGGVQLARGYLGRPALTADRFVPDPFGGAPGARLYRTGDLARYLPDGSIDYLGRLDHQVKIRGQRIEPGEIEAVLHEHPAVATAAVAVHDERLVAYLTGRPGPVTATDVATAPDTDEIRTWLRERLPDAMVPGDWMVLDTLPLTANGKTDRKALPAPDRTRDSRDGEYTAPRTPVERAIAEELAAALDMDQVGVHDRFFDLGGDSIRAIRAVGALQGRGLALSVQHLFTHPTVAGLATVAAEAGATGQRHQLVEPFAQLGPADRERLPDGLADAYPLGEVQAGMVYELLADPESNTYQNVSSFHFTDDGPFSLPALREAVRRLVDRHEILRTSFRLSGFSGPLQLVHRRAEAEVGFTDLRGLEPDGQRSALAEFRAAEQRVPFDLERAPLLRYHVHRTGERTWTLTHTECHAILDGWSHHSVIQEIRTDYGRVRDDADCAVTPPPRARYADFIALEQQALNSPEDRAFWQGRISDFPRLELPAPTALDESGGPAHEVRVSWAALDPALRRLAARTGTSLKTVLYAAHLKLLGMISGQQRFFAGAVCNGRPELPDGDEVRGMYLNTVPFAVDLDRPSWEELLRSVFTEEAAVWPHRRYPLPAMQREWGTGVPLVDVVFGYLDFHVLDTPGTAPDTVTDSSPNEFTFDVWTFPGELRMTCRPGWAGRSRLEAMATTFVEVLRTMAERPETSPAAFGAPLLTAPAVAPDARPLPPGMTLPEMIDRHSRPDDTALADAHSTVTYGELRSRSNQFAHMLRSRGIRTEDPVAVCLERGPETVIALLGVVKAGGCYVPIDPEYPEERIGHLLSDSGAGLLVTRSGLADRLTGLLADGPRTVLLDTDRAELEAQPETDPVSALSPDNTAYVIYTSGSTGRPKGVQVTHRNIVRLVHDESHAGLGPQDTVLVVSPLAFDASTFEMWGALGNGGRLAFTPPGTPTTAVIAEVLREHRVTVAFLTTSLFHLMVESCPEALTGLRTLLSGGDVLSPGRVRTALSHGIPVSNVYGPTECTTFSTAQHAITAEQTARPIPIGPPIAHTTALVTDEDLNPVPYGVAGELLLGGPGVARGYLGRPAMTADRFVPDPTGSRPGGRLYRTGDLVRQDPDGVIHFLGRRDHQVKVRGHRIELGEVDAGLNDLPGVRGAAAAVRPGPDGDKQLVGYVALDGNTAFDPAALRSVLRRRVPAFLVPSAWVRLDELPLNANGKLDRAALPAPERTGTDGGPVAPRTAAERALAEVWAEVLDVERVGAHDDFFLLGGHSLLILRAIALLRERHGLELTVRAFVEHQTLDAVAAAAERGDTGDGARSALMWLRREGGQAPLFCVHPGGGSAHWYQRLVPHLDADLPVAALEWPGLQSGPGRPVPTAAEMAGRYLSEIRQARPHGPYRLLGWCGGSGITVEVADRLRADGEEVTLILLDPGLDSHERQGLWDEFRLIESCTARLEELAAAGPEDDTGPLRGEILKLLNHLVDDADPVTGIVLPERNGADVWLPSARIWREVMEMTLTYRHRYYPGALHLLISDELARGEHEVALGQTYQEYLDRWRELNASVEAHRVPGDHFGVMRLPHVTSLADTLAGLLG
ncbi:amino acid adenylation domain-containing protein [Streptomyces sp. NPDC006288]|uniref:amino acid adenylation domain-containing protein n=1 Tax=Streptomyces sp. NPDC006288 TaxID=3156743 RepID=UPI0033AFBA66